MEEERDFVVFTDEDGTEFELDVIDYFEHEGQQYAVLTEFPEENESDEADEAALEVYIMKVETDGEYEEFLPPDEDKMELLCAIVEKRMQEGCECGEDCDCGEDHAHTCDCGCGKHEKQEESNGKG